MPGERPVYGCVGADRLEARPFFEEVDGILVTSARSAGGNWRRSTRHCRGSDAPLGRWHRSQLSRSPRPRRAQRLHCYYHQAPEPDLEDRRGFVRATPAFGTPEVAHCFPATNDSELFPE